MTRNITSDFTCRVVFIILAQIDFDFWWGSGEREGGLVCLWGGEGAAG